VAECALLVFAGFALAVGFSAGRLHLWWVVAAAAVIVTGTLACWLTVRRAVRRAEHRWERGNRDAGPERPPRQEQ
jgi:membrane protein YdbS with pleckstrin-like domain